MEKNRQYFVKSDKWKFFYNLTSNYARDTADPPLERAWKVLLGGVLWISVGSNEDPKINKLRKPIKKN